MNLQYISDSKGKTTGVFIPIKEWNALKKKFKDIDLEKIIMPNWHKEIVQKRLKDFKKNPKLALDFDAAMNSIEKEL